MKNKPKKKKPKKTLIVSPYLDQLGGGERYMLSIAKAAEDQGHEITVAWKSGKKVKELARHLGIKLKTPKTKKSILDLYFQGQPFKMLRATQGYDYIFYLSDGSIPMLGGKNNILHFQVPFHDVGGHSLLNRLKMTRISKVIVNSRFTKKFIDKEFACKSEVLYPPVKLLNPSEKKKKQIISVGRFDPSINTKRQDVLIDAFKDLYKKDKSWKLILAGGVRPENMPWVKKLKKQTKGYPVQILNNISNKQLRLHYKDSLVYWHAAGYMLNENKNPESTEHFGITTVEAISAGCIPLVVPKGGQKEIVNNSKLHWKTTEKLVEKTLSISSDTKKYQKLASSIPISKYDKSKFKENIKDIIIPSK